MRASVPKRGLAAAIAVACLMLPSAASAAVTYPPGFEDRVVASGLTEPTAVDWAPDGSAFITQRTGELLRVPPGGDTATEILDLSGHVNAYGDRGLEGVAVDRDFATNGYVYLAYVYELQPMMADSSSPMVSRVTRIRVMSNGTVADPTSPETVIVGTYDDGPCPPAANTLDCMPADSSSHMVGTVRSDPRDGTLWIGSGDGAEFSRVDTKALRSLDPLSQAGKILHVDRAGRGLPGHAFCPSNENLDHVCTKVYAKGFRNPFRFHLRPDGSVSVGDVGWNTREEINIIAAAGRSYGWPCYEGRLEGQPHRTPGYRDLPECAPFYAREGQADAEQPPAFDYGRSQGAAVIGGPTYTSTQYPAGYAGSMFYGDFVSQTLRRLTFGANGTPTSTVFATGWFGSDIELGPGGDVYFLDFGNWAPGTGALRRVVYTPGNASPRAVADATPRTGDPPLNVQFTGSASSDPDGDPLTYEWDFGDGSPHSSQPNPTHSYSAAGSFVARLTVTDGRGLSDSATVTITPGSTPPEVEIHAPAPDASYRNGDTIGLSGSATDAEEGNLPGSKLSWQVRVLHRDHLHPVVSFSGSTGSFEARRDHDADSSYEIALTATDSANLKTTRTIAIHPETVDLSVKSVPPGAPISYSGRLADAPFSQPTAIGYRTTVSAADTFSSGGQLYRFADWSDGGARLHDLTVPGSDFELVARYERVDPATAPTVPAVPPPAESGDEAPSGYRATVRSTRGLRALYGLGESGRVARDAWGRRAGAYRGRPKRVRSLVPSILGAAARAFDGVDDAVALPVAALGSPGAFSVEMWARPGRRKTLPRRSFLFSAARDPFADGFGLFIRSDGRVGAAAPVGRKRAGVAGPRLRSGRVYHLVSTFDGARLRLYVNGRRRASRAQAGGILWRRRRELALAHAQLPASAFRGRLDEVALYHRALTPREVAAHWAAR